MPLILAEATLPPVTTSAKAARSFASRALASLPEERSGVATLLVSELVTNTVLHARSDVRLSLRLHDGRLRVEVRDRSRGLPVQRRFGAAAGTGRGLLLVEALAEHWGYELEGEGKVVWFELDLNST